MLRLVWILLVSFISTACGHGGKEAEILLKIDNQIQASMAHISIESVQLKLIDSKGEEAFTIDASDFYTKGRTSVLQISSAEIKNYSADEEYDLISVVTGRASPKLTANLNVRAGGKKLEDAAPITFSTKYAIRENVRFGQGGRYYFGLKLSPRTILTADGLEIMANLVATTIDSSIRH